MLHDLAKMGLGKKVIATQRNVLNMIFDYAVTKGLIIYNPCASVKLPRGLHSERRALPTADDLKAVEKSDWLFPFFLLYTGCRRGEALAVTYEDIDRKNKVIRINKSVGFADNEPFLKVPKTEAGHRTVILLDKLAERIPKGTGLLFPNKNGQFCKNGEIQYMWKKWQKENGVTVTPHQLRHGYATILFDAGMSPKDAQYLLGHSTVAMTQDIYTHIRQERIKVNADKLNEYVNKV